MIVNLYEVNENFGLSSQWKGGRHEQAEASWIRTIQLHLFHMSTRLCISVSGIKIPYTSLLMQGISFFKKLRDLKRDYDVAMVEKECSYIKRLIEGRIQLGSFLVP